MARPRRRWYGDNGKFVVESLRHLMCMKMAKIYAKMYGRAFGTFLMHSKLGDIFTLRIVVVRPVQRAKGTSVHIRVWDSKLGNIFTLRIVVARPVQRAEGTSVHIRV